jgi:diguanylate cyclase (GGDEF)-like protein
VEPVVPVVGLPKARHYATLELLAAPAAVLWIAGVTIADLFVWRQVSLVALLSLAPFLVTLRPSQNATLAVGVLAIIAGCGLGWVQKHPYSAQQYIRVFSVGLSVLLAEWITVLRLRLDHALETTHRFASRDELTGVLTRRELLVQGNVLGDLHHHVRPPLSVLMIDLDHFKEVNDSEGHLVGDEVLTEVARRCQAALRAGDLLGRYGGDEFVAILVGGTHDQVTEVATRLLRSNEESIATGSGPLQVTVSVGMAVATGDDEPLESLIKRADVALYEAKGQGRDKLTMA